MKFNRSTLNEELTSTVESDVASTYRKYANLSDDAEISEVDEWALTETAKVFNMPKRDVRHKILGEDITLDQAARELEANAEEVHSKTEIENILDDMYKQARRMGVTKKTSGYPAVILEGEAGVGKTAIVSAWAAKNGVAFQTLDLTGLKPEMLTGIVDRHPKSDLFVMRKISTELLSKFKKPNTVLFIDEYNRGEKKIRNAFLNLILNHRLFVPTSGDFEADYELYKEFGELQPNGEIYLPNLLFVVAAQNPYSHRYSGTNPLDSAETDRFRMSHIEADPLQVKKYLVAEYTRQMKEAEKADDKELVNELKGVIALVETILSDPSFTFDSTSEREELFDESPVAKVLSPRSFEALMSATNGTKSDVIKKWNQFCNYKKKGMIENILSSYVDVDDKANNAVSDDTDSQVFGKNKSAWDKISSKFGL